MAGFYPVKHRMAGYNLMLWDVKNLDVADERGIRTLGTIFANPAFARLAE